MLEVYSCRSSAATAFLGVKGKPGHADGENCLFAIKLVIDGLAGVGWEVAGVGGEFEALTLSEGSEIVFQKGKDFIVIRRQVAVEGEDSVVGCKYSLMVIRAGHRERSCADRFLEAEFGDAVVLIAKELFAQGGRKPCGRGLPLLLE